MSSGSGSAALAWTSVHLGLFGFYWVAAQRFPSRGYARLALVMLSFANASLLLWWLEAGLSPGCALLAWRVLVVGGAFGPPLHTDFVLRFTGFFPEWRRLVRVGYAVALGIVIVDFGLVLGQLLRLFPEASPTPSPVVGLSMVAAMLLHMSFAVYGYVCAVRRGQRRLRFVVLLLGVIIPAISIDYSLTFVTGSGMNLSQFAAWIYGLVIALVLLLELRGAEGLLAQTATTLRERTHELEISYAELEFMHNELTQKQQLAAVGELAQAIAHEVRNPLAIIVNAASGLRRLVSEKDRQTLLSIIDEESARLNQLVSELLRFARPMKPSSAPVDIEEICEQFRERTQGHELVIHRADDEALPQLSVDAELLRLALDYVVENAVQSMPTPKRIDIVLRSGHLSDGNDALVIEVRDQGWGMTPEVLERAKKPFFTTRPRGTGLGLSIVERIVEAHRGELELVSSLGKGTTVLLRFPRSNEALVGAHPSAPGRRKAWSRGGSLSDRPPDSVPPDSAQPDTASLDTASLDTASLDTASLDTASLDTASLDTASLDTASLDTASLDTASLDTASLDTASLDTASLDTASLDTAPLDTAQRGADGSNLADVGELGDRQSRQKDAPERQNDEVTNPASGSKE